MHPTTDFYAPADLPKTDREKLINVHGELLAIAIACEITFPIEYESNPELAAFMEKTAKFARNVAGDLGVADEAIPESEIRAQVEAVMALALIFGEGL